MIKLFGDINIPAKSYLTKNEIILFSYLLSKKTKTYFSEIESLFLDIKEVDQKYVRRIVQNINKKLGNIGYIYIERKTIKTEINCDVDIWKFEELLKNKSDISEILGIYTGPFFPSINCIWANKMRMYYQKIIKKIVENYLKKEHIDIETLYKILRVFPELSTSELLEEPI